MFVVRKVSFSLPIFQRRVVSVSVIVWKRVSKLLVNFIHEHITGRRFASKNYERTRREDSRVNQVDRIERLLEPSFS